MNYKSYAAYLRSDEWKEKRTKIRRRARGWCERCKVRRRVDVHHLTYINLGNEPPRDLIAVCRQCHDFLHGKQMHDPASVSFSKDEIKQARHLMDLVDIGMFQGTGVSLDGFCEKWPEYETVRRKLEL